MKKIFFLIILTINLVANDIDELKKELKKFTKKVELLENENSKLKDRVDNLTKTQNEKDSEFIKRMEFFELNQKHKELKEQVDILEEQDTELSERLSKITEISGYSDVEYKFTNKNSDNNGFRLHHLALFYKKHISDNWKFFSEIEYEDGARISSNSSEGEIFVEVLSLEYQLNQYLNFRFGRFLTPAGIWNVEHYPPFVATQQRPLHIRKIFPQNSDGISLYGTNTKYNSVIDYNIYIANGKDTSGEGDDNENKAVGAQLKFHFPILSDTILGFSVYKDIDKSRVELNAYGVDLKLKYSDFSLQSEYANGDYKDQYNDYGYYLQFMYDIYNFSLIYRYDIFKEINSKYRIDTFALNYHFTPLIVAKLEYNLNKPENEKNYEDTILSISAYLSKW